MLLEDYYTGAPLYKDAILHEIQDNLENALHQYKNKINDEQTRTIIKCSIDNLLNKYKKYFKNNIESIVSIPTDEYGIEDLQSIDVMFKRKN